MDILRKYSKALLLCSLLLCVGACKPDLPVRQYALLSMLEHSLINAKVSSDQALEALKKDVKKNGNSREGLERIKRSELLKKKTVGMIGDLEKLKQKLVKDAGQGLDEKTHMPKRPLNTGATAGIMRKETKILSKKLNKFTNWLAAEFKDLDLPKFELLGAGKNDLSFYATYFDGVNLAEALCVITRYQLEVLRYQSEVLKKLGAGDLTADLKFDRGFHRPQMSYATPGAERYAQIYYNQFYTTAQKPLSTFSIDVDNASYTNVRRYLNSYNLPPKNAVRVEEMINYFDYDYPQPQSKKDKNGKEQTPPFSVNTEYGACPWNPANKLLHIGLQGMKIKPEKMPVSNLVFLIDASGSMSGPNGLPLLKQSLKVLLNQLTDERTTIAIVAYAGASGLVLPPTSAIKKQKIIDALENITSGGSTAGGEGITLAYKTAQQAFIKGGNNRVILATDGDFNVGVTSDEALVSLIEQKRKTGIYLTCMGFGIGNLNDSMMEKLTNAGNGNYFYIDNLKEAKKTLANDLTGTIVTIAKDVKIQLEFNPAYVKSYRLVGYENRVLTSKDFKNDKVDAGELGAGHTVTALYEIVPGDALAKKKAPLKYQFTQVDSAALASNELATIKLRYKKPDANRSQLIEQVVQNKTIARASNNFMFSAAVAALGMRLRQSPYVGKTSYTQIYQWASASLGKDDNGYRKELLELIKKLLEN